MTAADGTADAMVEGALAADARARRVVDGMLEADTFTGWLGAEVVEVGVRRCVLRMTVRDDMLNGVGTCHGGVTFGLADSAFAFACNAHGTVCVALDCTVSYPNAARVGDVLTATAEAELEPRRVGFFRVTVANAAGAIVALFRGTSYDTRRPHAIDDALEPA
ncbi:MAG TPA: hydroxyphenylacetyl-CoA thioesterase PaaI [Gemmatirosa sp.]